MDLSAPHRALAPGADGEVLLALSRTTAGLTGRQVAAQIKGASVASVHRALRRLVEQGVIESRQVGKAILYTFNTRHLVAPAVVTLAGVRAELIRRLSERLSVDPRPRHASLFGSAARGDGGVGSDIDLFIVRPATISEDDVVWQARLQGLAEDVRDWTGNSLSISEVSVGELGRLRRSRPGIVAELEKDAVTIVGQPIRRLLARAP